MTDVDRVNLIEFSVTFFVKKNILDKEFFLNFLHIYL